MTDDREHRSGDSAPKDEQDGDDAGKTLDAAVPEPASDDLADAVGAYLLDALPEGERAAFERFLSSSPDAREEARQLAPVVALLPALFETETATVAAESATAPADALRERVVAAAEREPQPAPAENEAGQPAAKPRTIRTIPEATGPFGVDRPRGRRATAPVTGTRTPPVLLQRFQAIPLSWMAAGLAGIVAIGAIFWALALQGRIDSKDREIRAQAAQIGELRKNANATAFTLASSSGQAPDASGTLLYSVRDQIGVLYVRNLPRLDADRVYQLWYLDDDSSTPRPGGTFRVDRNGTGVVSVDPETPTHDAIALTEEPQGGSDAPTSEILMQGRLGGAAG